MSKLYKQKKSLKLKNLRKRKSIKQRGGSSQNANPIKTINNLDKTLELLEETYELNKTLNLNNKNDKNEKNNNNEKQRKTTIVTQQYNKNRLKYMIELFNIYWKLFFTFKKNNRFDYDNLINMFTLNINILTDDSKHVMYKLSLNIDDIINAILLQDKEDNNYNIIRIRDYIINDSYINNIFNDQPSYNKNRKPIDKIKDNTYIKDSLNLFIMQLFDENLLFNYDILQFSKMFKDNLKKYIKFYASDNELPYYKKYQDLNNEYLNFIYLYSNLKKIVCNHIYTILLQIDKSKFTATQKDVKKIEIINKHKNFLETLLEMLNEKNLYFLNQNNNAINKSKLNTMSRASINNKLSKRISRYLPEKEKDEKCIKRIQQMLNFINHSSNSGSGGKSMKESLAL